MADNNNAATIHVDIVDSEKQIYSGSALHVIATAYEGEVGIYPHHIPFLCKLKPGVLRLQVPQSQYQLVFAVSGGFLEVQSNHVTVLADIVERSDELDEMRLIKQKEIAESRYKHAQSSLTTDVAKARAALEVAIAGLKTFHYLKHHSKHNLSK